MTKGEKVIRDWFKTKGWQMADFQRESTDAYLAGNHFCSSEFVHGSLGCSFGSIQHRQKLVDDWAHRLGIICKIRFGYQCKGYHQT
jgi:hypothetical protein